MSTRNLKTMFIVISVLVVISAGLTFMEGAKGTGTEDNQQQITANQEVSVCSGDCDKPCCKEKKDLDKCPADCDKPCCKKQSLSCCGF